MIKFICYPKCSTCKKAQAWLDENGVSYEIRDIKNEKPTRDELRKWIAASGLDIKKFFNTSGILYRELDLKNRLADMSDDERLELLASDGMLVKRPIAVANDVVLVGFNADKWTALK